MRSRYSAFAMGDADYLMSSWHSSTRPRTLDLVAGQEWLQLKIIGSREGEEESFVEFIARSRVGGRTELLHEVSRFSKDAGRWFYVDGVIRD